MKRQTGNMLMEALLALAIIGMIASAALPMLKAGQIEESARAVADDMSSFQRIAAQHFISNRSAYEAAMKDGTGADKLCMVGVNPDTGAGGVQANSTTQHTCAIDGSMLKYLLAMPKDMNPTNRFGEAWVAVFRQIYDKETTPKPTGAVDMLVISAVVNGVAAPVVPDAERYSEVVSAATILGGTGGYLPDADRSTCVAQRATSKYEVCGNGWKVKLDDFISAADLTAFSNRLAN